MCLSRLDKVRSFFETLEDLRQATDGAPAGNTRMLQACEKVSLCGEQVVLCLEQQIWQHNRAAETAQEVSAVFRLGLRRIIQLRRECTEMKRYLKEMQLAERNIDATETGLPPLTYLQEKQRQQRDFTIPGSAPLPSAVSFEDLRRHRDHQLSSKRSMDSFGNMRRAKSDTDVALQSLKKKVESLTVDNTKLKDSEKKLIKEKIKLTRHCKMLEVERDRAEDRLKIEQTQRDSVEKLRQRNKELEDQLRSLCESQVLRERERAEQQQKTDTSPEPTADHPGDP